MSTLICRWSADGRRWAGDLRPLLLAGVSLQAGGWRCRRVRQLVRSVLRRGEERARSGELGLDRLRLCLGLAKEVAAVPLSRKSAGQRALLRPCLGSPGDRRARGVADAGRLGE